MPARVRYRIADLSEEQRRRHYNMLFEIAKHFIKDYLLGTPSGNVFMRITDLYESLHISSRAGDKILDRLEDHEYITCIRSRRYRLECIPTFKGLIALLRRPEYREELLKQYEKLRALAELADLIEDEDELDELTALLNDLRKYLLENKTFLRILMKRILKDLNHEAPLNKNELINDLVNMVRDSLTEPHVRVLTDLGFLGGLYLTILTEGDLLIKKLVLQVLPLQNRQSPH